MELYNRAFGGAAAGQGRTSGRQGSLSVGSLAAWDKLAAINHVKGSGLRGLDRKRNLFNVRLDHRPIDR
jgi:hypothetical protein